MFGFGKKVAPAFKITVQTQVGVGGYLFEQSSDRAGSPDPQQRNDSHMLGMIAEEFLRDINRPQKAILALKGLRKGLQRIRPEDNPEGAVAVVTEIFFIETLLNDLGVTNFEP